MMKKLWFAAIAALALVGCNEKVVEQNEAQGGEKVQITVNLSEGVTKVTGAIDDAKVNNLQIFVFDKYGVYETSSNGSGSSLSLTCTSGEKQIVALANAPIETGVTDINVLRSRISDLKDCAVGSIVMAGEVSKTLTASSTVTIQVERLAARIALTKINLAFEQEQHRQLPFKVKAVYLINVAGDRAYLSTNTPSVWYNKAKYIAATSPSFLYDVVTSGDVSSGGSYTKGHYFYCYPNNTATKTRLVVESEIGGNTYYYPITLDTVDPNTAYTYNLTITRLGSDSPDMPVEEGAIKFTVTVKDWVEQDINETI